MIQIDIDMPKSCFECDKTYKWKDTGEVQCPHINMPSISSNRDCRPPYCPLKEVSDNSVLEDIKAEMKNLKDNRCFCHHYERGINECINVLNKHMESVNSLAESKLKNPKANTFDIL